MEFYIAVNGNDTNPGTKESPFATPAGALAAIRAAREHAQAQNNISPVTVHIMAGEYRVDGLHFDARDGGSARAPVLWQAEGNVVFNGGMALDAARFGALTADEKARLHGDAKEKVVCADLSALGLSRADWGELCPIGSYHTARMYDGYKAQPMWCELFVDDRRQEIARYPDAGYLHTEEPVFEGQGREHQGKRKYSDPEWAVLRNPQTDIYRLDKETARRTAGWKTTDGAWVFGYPMYGWADMSAPVTRINAETGEMELAWVSLYGMKPHAPYYFYNIFEELDAPGEWYLDRETGRLYLYPDCDLVAADINLSLTTKPILSSDGADYITFSGITFTGTRADAVVFSGDHIKVENCTVKNVAGNAVVLTGNNNTVIGCEIMHTGRGGVILTGGDRNTLTPSGCTVEENHIHHIAEIFRTYQPAVKLYGVGNLCRHNCIHDSAHMAIGFYGNNHIMEYNKIYEVCQIADDSGAIYAGRDYTISGNVVRYNYFHDMKSEADNHIGIFGMYCDDNLGGCTIVGNVFEHCQSALLLHGGHDMVFSNNLIIGACPKSAVSVFFHAYGYWHDLDEGGTHGENLALVPWQSEVWRRAYPHLAEYLTWDPETEQRYPHYCTLSNNVTIAHKPWHMNFAWDDERFHNRMEDNTVLDEMPKEDLLTLCREVLPAEIPGFAPIPLEKMGLTQKPF